MKPQGVKKQSEDMLMSELIARWQGKQMNFLSSLSFRPFRSVCTLVGLCGIAESANKYMKGVVSATKPRDRTNFTKVNK